MAYGPAVTMLEGDSDMRIQILGVKIKIVAACTCLLIVATFAPRAMAKPAVKFQSMKVVSNTLNVRIYPGANYKASNILNKGQVVDLVGEASRWLQIRWPDGDQYRTGYANPRYLKGYRQTMYYAKEQVGLRSSADLADDNLIGVMEPADAVELVKRTGIWSLVECNGMRGYILSKHLTGDRKNCFLTQDVAFAIGKRDIQEVSYTFASAGLEDIDTRVLPTLEVSYRVRMNPGNSLWITLYRFDSAQSAQQVRNDISQTMIHPDWTRQFYQSGDRVVCIDLKGLEFSKSEYARDRRIRAAIRELYGEAIPFL